MLLWKGSLSERALEPQIYNFAANPSLSWDLFPCTFGKGTNLWFHGVCVETCYPRAWLGWARRKWSPGSTSSSLMYQCQYIQILALFPCGVSQKMKTALFYELLLWNSLLWTVIYLSFYVSGHHKRQTPQWLNCLYESSFQRGKRWKPTYATTLYDTSVWEGSYQF